MPKTSPPSCTVRTVSVFAVIWEAETACAAAFSGSGRPMSPHTESISKAAVPTLAANVRMPSKSEMSRRFGACGCGLFSKFKPSHLLAEKFRKLKRAFCFYFSTRREKYLRQLKTPLHNEGNRYAKAIVFGLPHCRARSTRQRTVG